MIDYQSYRNCRAGDEPAQKVFSLLKEAEARRDSMDLPALLDEVVLSVLVFTVVVGFVAPMLKRDRGTLWIASPSGDTVRNLPLPAALRIIRRRSWRFAAVAPVALTGKEYR